jgi:hypothetical protein
MPRAPAARKSAGKKTRKRRRGGRRRVFRFWPGARLRRRWLRAFRRAPVSMQVAVTLTAALAVFLVINGVYQVLRKPTELFFPVSGTLFKNPTETWREYGPIFRRHATAVMTPELLAALAQVEGSGNPVARTYWRWSWSLRPFEIYRPATSAVGMYQITDGTFAEARHYCIHDHHVVEDGPWDDWRSCWLNSLYFRVVPSHAVELTSAYLDVHVHAILMRYHPGASTLQQKQELAALIHLCGAGAGAEYARRGLRLAEGQRCGDHEARVYLARVEGMKRVFAQLAAREAAGG